MQSLATFFEDNKPLAYAAVVAAVIVLVFVVFCCTGCCSAAGCAPRRTAGARQPRLGIVDAYDLDRQRQLVLVRRDNVEHLIMIGGPTDVVIESSIVRTQSAASPREKDGSGPPMGGFTASPSLGSASAPASLAQTPAAALPPAGSRTEPSMASRNEPAMASRDETSSSSRSEPAVGVPMPSPNVERATAERGGARPVAVPDPYAPPPPFAPGSAGSTAQPPRNSAPRPTSLPPRPTSAPPSPQGAAPSDRPAAARPPLPPRPPVQRPPLPPRPSLASSLPPRPPRPPLPNRTEPTQVESGSPIGPGQDDAAAQRSAADVQSVGPATGRTGPSSAAPRTDAPAGPSPTKSAEMLESLEEEMAKLLGRPTPRRDG